MNYLTRALSLPMDISLATWAWLWAWTYPLAKPSIAELRTGSRLENRSGIGLFESLRFALHLPVMARSQHYAERSAMTSTATPHTSGATSWEHVSYMRRWRSEQLWRTRFRESIIWASFASWLVTWASISASVIFTGDFLFEVHESSGAPGYVSNYFKVAAVTFLLPFALTTLGLVTLGTTRRFLRQ